MNVAERLREQLVVLGFGPVKETGENSKPEDFFNALRLKNGKCFGVLIINKKFIEIELARDMRLNDLLDRVNFVRCAAIPAENPQ